MKYTREVSLACECTRAVLSVLVKCVLMHARRFFRKKCTRAHTKIASKSQILEKYSVIPHKNLANARVSLCASVKLNLSCTVNHFKQGLALRIGFLLNGLQLASYFSQIIVPKALFLQNVTKVCIRI